VRKASFIRVVSDTIRNKLIRSGIQPKNIATIHTPINVLSFEIFDAEKVIDLKYKYGKNILLYIGRLEKVKNVSSLIYALKHIVKKYDHLTLLIIGDGSEKERLKNIVDKLDLKKHIKFLGRIPHKYLVNYYYAADMLILPSYHESFGKVLVEASITGTPSISTKTTGGTELSRKMPIELYDMGNISQLSTIIMLYLDNEDKRILVGDISKEMARNIFSQTESILQIVNLWKKLVINKN